MGRGAEALGDRTDSSAFFGAAAPRENARFGRAGRLDSR
jgi:hypothetical protein